MNERLYFDPELKSESKTLWLNEDESHHLVKVNRAKAGESLSLINGKGIIASATLIEIAKKKCLLNINSYEVHPAPKTHIHLGICPLKKRDKMELIIEKATEMGVTEISIIQSDFSERTKINMSRFDKIKISAVKQSVNPYAPIINPVLEFNSFIEKYSARNEQKLIAWCGTKNENHLTKEFKSNQDVIILIGPEGDFSEQEINQAIGKNFVPVNLGNLRLRSETAALFAIAAIQTLKETNT